MVFETFEEADRKCCSVACARNDIHFDWLYGIWSWHWNRWTDRWQAFEKGAAGEKRNGTGGYDFIRNRYGGIDHRNDRAVFCLFKSEWSLCRYDDEWCEVILIVS